MDRKIKTVIMLKDKRHPLRLIVDAGMLLLLLCLMSYQVTGEALHEWIGVCMTLTVIVHQILNRRWYAAIFKGKYNAYRGLTTLVNVLLLAAMLATAFCGMAMSEYAIPFLYWTRGVFLVRPTHLAMSHWAFLLMGLHLGLHLPVMAGKWKLGTRTKAALSVFGAVLGGIGFWLFGRNGMPNYLFFRVPFAFLDYEKAGWLVFLENALMLLAWAFLDVGVRRELGDRRQTLTEAACRDQYKAVLNGDVLRLLRNSCDRKCRFCGRGLWRGPPVGGRKVQWILARSHGVEQQADQ